MKNIIKVCLALSVISVFVLSCTSKTLNKDKKSTLSPDTNLNGNASGNPTTSTSSTVIPDDGSPKDTIAAFKDVLKVLHAPYEAEDCFFKLKFDTPSTDTAPAAIVKNGSDSTITDAAGIGAGSPDGKGTYTITATGKPKTASNGTDAQFAIPETVTYEYTNYQPKGSHIIINGKIETEEYTTVLNCLLIKKGKHTLKITGLYEANLLFDASNRGNVGEVGYLRELSQALAGAGLCASGEEDVNAFALNKGIKLTFTYKNGTPLTVPKSRDDSPLLKSFLKLPVAK